jgi:hypothetical protein
VFNLKSQFSLPRPQIRFAAATDLTPVWRTIARSGKRVEMSEADNKLLQTLQSSMHPNDLLILFTSKNYEANHEALFLVNDKERRDFEDLTAIYEALKTTSLVAAEKLFQIIVQKLQMATRLPKSDIDGNYGYYNSDYQIFYPQNGDKDC